MPDLRVALFADSYHEANGVARTVQALETYAHRRGLPLLVVHAGPETTSRERGSVTQLSLKRSGAAFAIEHDLKFDVALWRHAGRVRTALRDFRPDVVHFTGPSDIGQLGAWLGYRLGIPMVASWHTNLHQYARKRLAPWVTWLPERARGRLARKVERRALDLTLAFYRMPRAILAPNDDLLRLLTDRTCKPTFLMSRGVDTRLFDPSRRSRTDSAINVGYVGRLSPEKGVRALATIADELRARGRKDVRFTIVGEGRERGWLQEHLPQTTFSGVLRGEALATAYANMDLFAFPSTTETVGNVVLEALASGVPVVAMNHGALASLVRDVADLATTEDEFAQAALTLIEDADRRRRLAGIGRSHALTLSWDRIFDRVYQVYQLAASSAPPADVPVVSVAGPGAGRGHGMSRPAASVAARSGHR